MSLFKCLSPGCPFEADVDAPGGADAMKCPICDAQAIEVNPARPAFKCSSCNRVFRASGSKNRTEKCAKCGGTGQRIEFSGSGGAEGGSKGKPAEQKKGMSVEEFLKDFIEVVCPSCKKTAKAPPQAAGKKVRCDICHNFHGKTVWIPVPKKPGASDEDEAQPKKKWWQFWK